MNAVTHLPPANNAHSQVEPAATTGGTVTSKEQSSSVPVFMFPGVYNPGKRLDPPVAPLSWTC